MRVVVGVLILLLSGAVNSHDAVKSDVFAEIVITPKISVLQGKGGNIGLIKGEDGFSIIDDDYKQNDHALVDILAKVTSSVGMPNGSVPDYVINTHWHRDHTGGNEILGGDSIIVAHENVRKRLSTQQSIDLFNLNLPPISEAGLPQITYQSSISFHIYDQTLTMVHYPNGHTDGDSVVFMQPANVVHMGDHYFQGRFPFIDIQNGGDVRGMARNIENVLSLIDDKTVVIPGHGGLSDKQELASYKDMLKSSMEAVNDCHKAGLDLIACQQKGLSPINGSWGKGFINETTWIKILYRNLRD